ncbi:MAG: 50S ribosomal protein L6 [bacterium]|nr:50S ribosomal protein L6 [bacterium]
MSRIGKLPIEFESGVNVTIKNGAVQVKGSKGELKHDLPVGISAEMEGQRLLIKRRDDSKRQRSLHGLTRALLANAVHGVSKGFTKELEIHGVGYRAEMAGKALKLSLGYSHPIEFAVPAGIQVAVEKNTKITISGHDRQAVGQVAADIRKLRKPDVYKLKGIRYAGEQLRKKAGKTGA